MTRDELHHWGAVLGAALQAGDVVALRGDLGAGKTTFAQAIASGFGVPDAVTSPTYALVHRYEGARGLLWHLDLYRLAGERELEALGWDEILSGEGAVMIEWPERAGRALPAVQVEVHLSTIAGDPDRRRLVVR